VTEPLLPHRGEALFLRDVTSFDARSVAAVASVPRGSCYASEGRAEALLAIELAAQAAAAHAAATGSRIGEREAAGLLVGVKELRLRVAAFPCDEEVTVSASLEGRAQQLAIWRFEVACASVGVIASGTLSVWQDGA
jgi:predicted hotdog family 3-hydroxylacyl-ACP dehydratase